MENSQIIKEVNIENGKVLVDNAVFFTGETNEPGPFLKSLYKRLNLKYNKYFKMDPLSKLGFLATEVLLLNEGIANETDEVAIVLANASSSLNTDVKYQESIKEIPSPSVFVYTLPNIVIGEISIKNKFYGEHMFFVQPSYNKKELLDYTACLFNTTPCKHAIVGWVDVDTRGDYSARLMLCQNNK
ncbi:hypothetical protein [Carboxylicivirga sp. RSCT41]|uniref:hypothetical protein n=1 Tax=Carboxylicivirga agarovorans TaxID=3417570 RepID=UPI003D336B43